MLVYETLFISTFTISCLRIRDASFLVHNHNQTSVRSCHADATLSLRRKRLYIRSENLPFTQQPGQVISGPVKSGQVGTFLARSDHVR